MIITQIISNVTWVINIIIVWVITIITTLMITMVTIALFMHSFSLGDHDQHMDDHHLGDHDRNFSDHLGSDPNDLPIIAWVIIMITAGVIIASFIRWISLIMIILAE